MPLPTLDKTYQFARASAASTVNVSYTGSSSINDHRAFLFQIVGDLINFPLSPWTVSGSSNSSTAGMDGVNRWAATANIVFATSAGTAHSWIVLRQTGIAAKCEICIDLISPAGVSNAGGSYMAIAVSPSAGFGADNGGTNGSATTRPTAVDEFIATTTAQVDFLNGGTSSVITSFVTNVIMSTDGQVTRIFVRIPGSRWCAYFCIEKPKSPLTQWTDAIVARWHSVPSGEVMTYANWNVAPSLLYTRTPAGDRASLFITCEGFNGAAAGAANILVRNDLNNEWEMYPAGLASLDAGFTGRHGRLFDYYWISSAHIAGTYFPADGTRQWIAVGTSAQPWNGTVATIS